MEVAAGVGHWKKLEEEEDIQGAEEAAEAVAEAVAEEELVGLTRHNLSVVLVVVVVEEEEEEEEEKVEKNPRMKVEGVAKH